MRLRGYIDGIIGGDLVGWVLDEEDPERRVTVRAELDGRPLGARRAGEPRNDLRAAGIGDGRAGFRFELDVELAPGEHEVLVVADDSDVPLPLADDWMVLDRDDRPRRGVALVPASERARGAVGTPEPARETAPPAPPERPEPTRAPAPVTAVQSEEPAGDLRALVGAAGWLYPCPPQGLDAMRGAYRPSFAAVDAAVAAVEEVHAAAREAGAAVVVVSVPDKMHVYPEYLPPGLEVWPENRLARLVEARLRQSDTAGLLDLLGVLRDARAHGRVFSRTGSNLTWLGAFQAYRAIVKALAYQLPKLEPVALGHFGTGSLEPVQDSLADVPLVSWVDGTFVELASSSVVSSSELEPSTNVLDVQRQVTLPGGCVVHDEADRRIARLVGLHLPSAKVVKAGRFDPAHLRRGRAQVVIWLTRLAPGPSPA